jgi:hypothetical protein
MRVFILAGLGLLVGGCAPSILHFGSDNGIAIPGEVPRDARGEPVWSAIRPMPPGAVPVTPGAVVPVTIAEGSTP